MTIDRNQIRWNGWGWAAHQDGFGAREEIWTWLAQELGMPSLLATPAQAQDQIALGASNLSAAEKAQFVAMLGADRVRDDAYERMFHARGRSYHDLLRLRAGELSSAPDAVLYPRGSEEVLAVLAFAHEAGIAVVPFGGGTGVVGGATANRGPFKAVVTLDVTGLDRVHDIDANDGTAIAETGIYGVALEKALQAKGLTLGHYPQSFEFSTLGGWIAQNGAGQQSLRYGSPRDWLLAVKLATPRGLFSTHDFPASAAGPRLTDLVLGSEGIFGVITEATLRVRPSPARAEYHGFLFRDFASGAAAIHHAMQDGVPAAMLRLSDAEETRIWRNIAAFGTARGLSRSLARTYLRLRGFDSGACELILCLEGKSGEIENARRQFTRIARRLGAISSGPEAGRRWREHRFQLPYLRDPMMDRGVGVDTIETAANWSKLNSLYVGVSATLEEAIRATVPRADAKGIVLCHIGHAYREGASLCFTYVFPRALGNEITQWQTIKKAATDTVVAHGGTISHHHGVGEDHLPWMAQQSGALGVEVLKAAKRVFDPNGILNPGKLVP